MKHDKSNKTYGDLLRQAAETGFPDKETTRRRILAYAETENASDPHSPMSPAQGKSPGDRMHPHRRKTLPPGKRIALAGGFLAAALAIVLIAVSLLNGGNTPPVSPETTLPPITDVSDEESSPVTEPTTAEPAETAQETITDAFMDGILLDQGMLYSLSGDLTGPVRFSVPDEPPSTSLALGGHYRLTFDGTVMESYPPQIHVSAIELLDSADSAWIAEADINEAVNFIGYNQYAFLVDGRETGAHGTGIIPIPDSFLEEDYRETILLPLPVMKVDPGELVAALSEFESPDPAPAEPAIFVYAETREESVEAARLIKEAGFPVTVSLGAFSDYEGVLDDPENDIRYIEHKGYLLQEDLFFAEALLRQSRYAVTYLETEADVSDQREPVYVFYSDDTVDLNEIANADFEPTSESLSYPRYLLDFSHGSGQEQFFSIDSNGVAAGSLLGEGNYRISNADTEEVFTTIEGIYRTYDTGALAPGLILIGEGSIPEPLVIGGYYRAAISNVMTASDPPFATIKEAALLEEPGSNHAGELPIWVCQYLRLFDSVSLVDIRASDAYDTGFIPARNSGNSKETLNMPLASIQDETADLRALIEAELAPGVPLDEHVVFVYGETSEEAAEAVRLFKQAGVLAALSVGSIDDYEGELSLPANGNNDANSAFDYRFDEIDFTLKVESPSKIVLEAQPHAEDSNIAASYGTEYAIDIKNGYRWEPAPLVPGSDTRQLNEWTWIVPDDDEGYRVMQPTDIGFESVPDSSFRESFDLTSHTLLQPGESYRLSKHYRFTIGDRKTERTYRFEFHHGDPARSENPRLSPAELQALQDDLKDLMGEWVNVTISGPSSASVEFEYDHALASNAADWIAGTSLYAYVEALNAGEMANILAINLEEITKRFTSEALQAVIIDFTDPISPDTPPQSTNYLEILYLGPNETGEHPHQGWSFNSEHNGPLMNISHMDDYGIEPVMGTVYRVAYERFEETDPPQIPALAVERVTSLAEGYLPQTTLQTALNYYSYFPNSHLIDVRSRQIYDADYEAGKIAARDYSAADTIAENWPLEELRDMSPPLIPERGFYYVYGETKEQADEAQKILIAHGYETVFSLGALEQNP